MLWHEYPEALDDVTLAAAYQTLQGDPPAEIPWMVWLLENPASRCALLGNIDLFGHDCMHLLLKKGFSSADEAYVVGFTMGNNIRATWWHLLLFKIAAVLFYPPKYRLQYSELSILQKGFQLGRSTKIRNLNQLCLEDWRHKNLREIRREIDLEIASLEFQAFSSGTAGERVPGV
jgi:hypothetical protein